MIDAFCIAFNKFEQKYKKIHKKQPKTHTNHIWDEEKENFVKFACFHAQLKEHILGD